MVGKKVLKWPRKRLIIFMNENQEVKKCFVCGKSGEETVLKLNPAVMLKVCGDCEGSEEEKRKETELLDSLSDGLFCGCI